MKKLLSTIVGHLLQLLHLLIQHSADGFICNLWGVNRLQHSVVTCLDLLVLAGKDFEFSSIEEVDLMCLAHLLVEYPSLIAMRLEWDAAQLDPRVDAMNPLQYNVWHYTRVRTSKYLQ